MFFDKLRGSIKIVIIIAVITFAISTLWSQGISFVSRNPADYYLVARVGKKRIEQDQFQQVFATEMERQRNYFGTVSPDRVEGIKAYALDRLIDYYLMLDAVEKEKIQAPQEDIDKAMGEFKGQFEDDAQYKEWLEYIGYTEKMISDVFAEDIKLEKLIEKMAGNVTVTDTEIEEAFESIKQQGDTLEDMRDYIGTRLMEIKRAEQFEKWLLSYRDKVKITIVDPQIAAYNHLVAGEYDKAIDKYEEALKKYGDDPYIYTSIGQAYMDLGLKDKGISTYQKALTLNEADPSLHLFLGNAYMQAEKETEALKSYKNASELATGNSYSDLMIHYTLADIYNSKELTDEAAYENEIISGILAAMALQDDTQTATTGTSSNNTTTAN